MRDSVDHARARQRIERALAALAGSGRDSTRFAVILEPTGGAAQLDRSMTTVLAVPPGGLASGLEGLDADGLVAWAVDAWADPGLDPPADLGGEPMQDWFVGTVAELETSMSEAVGAAPGWLVIDAEAPTEATDAVLKVAIQAALDLGLSPSRAAKEVAASHGVSKRRVYELTLETTGR